MKTEQEWMACFVKADDMFERCKVIRQIRREQHEATIRAFTKGMDKRYIPDVTFESTQEGE
jgi:hypothetical protein